MIPMILESTLIPFGIQLWLCFRGKTNGRKWAPLIVVAVLDVLCWGGFLTATQGGDLTLPYLLAVLCLMWLVGIVLAWLTYFLVKAVQKRRKNFGV